MNRPTKQAVIEAIRRDNPYGKARYIEAVRLDSGILVVEYEVSSPVDFDGKDRMHVTQRVILKSPENRVYTSLITKSWFD